MKSVLSLFFVLFLSSYFFCQSFPYTLPLKVGNYWNYVDVFDGSNTKFSFSVIDSQIVINNNNYYKVANIYNIYNPPVYIYLRYDTLDNFYKAYRHKPGLPPPEG